MIERKSFTGGLSTDRDGAYLQANQYLNALNIRISSNEEGSEGALSNIKGNEKVTFTMPNGTNTCIGSFEDAENHRIFYFIHNSNADHMILCYFHKEGTIRKVMENDDFEGSENKLEFSTSNLITGVAMNDDLLFFTDGATEPKRINVERGLKKHDGSYTQLKSYDNLAAYGDLRDTMITIIRQSPTLPPTQVRINDTSVNYNLIKDEAYTFAYRFVYVDGEISSLSPYSEISHYPNPDTTTPETDNNTIIVTIPANQEIGRDVYEVEYLVKYGQEPDFSVFYTERNYNAITAHDDDGIELVIAFRNDTTRLAIPTTDVTRYSSAVPVKAQALEAARGRVFLGNTTEGLDNINESGLRENASIYPYIQQSSGNMVGNYVMWKLDYIDSGGINQRVYFRFVKVSGSAADGYYEFSGSGNPLPAASDEVDDWLNQPSLDPTRYPASQDLTGQTKVADGGYNAIRTYVGTQVPSGGTLRFAAEAFTGGVAVDTSVTISAGLVQATITLTENLRLWKSASAYRFALLFMDRYGRQGRVIELTDNNGISIPDRGSAYSNVVQKVNWELPTTSARDYIPEWAHSYSFVRTKSLNKSFFVQFPIKDMHYVADFDKANQSHNYSANIHKYIQVEISSLQIEDLGYNFSEGDLITIHNLGGNQYTLQVVNQTETDIYALVTKSLGGLNVTTYTAFAEIFTPRLINENEPYFEFGETYVINSPGTASRTWSTSSGYFDGDIVIKTRQFGTGSDIHMQVASANFNNANDWLQLTGRGFVTTRFQQVVKPFSISFSENRLIGTLINGLSTFNSLDEKSLPSEMGPIQKLLLTSKTESTGNVMLAIGNTETASVYIGEAQVQTSGGGAFLAVQSGVIGSAQVLRGSYGTMHPESVVENNSRVYFLDALNGTVVQYDVNGLMPIGDKGVKSFFRERCNRIIIEGSTGCFAGFDSLEDEYILTLPAITYDDQEYLEDYLSEIANANILDGFQDQSYSDVTLTITADVKAGRKYRVEIEDLLIDGNNPFDSFTIKYSDGTVIGNTSTETTGGYIEFEATQASASLQIFIEDPSGQTPHPDDYITISVSEFRVSYYQLEDGEAKTIAYSESMQGWTTFYSYLPEQMQSVGTQFITFKNGELWKHNVSDTRNNFYGTQYKSRVTSISKQGPSAVKVFHSLAIEGDTPPSFAHFRTEAKYMDRTSSGAIPSNPTYSDYVQSSDLSDSEFRQLEGVYYAAILRDRLQPPPAGYDAAVYNTNMLKGEKLINQFMLFTLEFDNTSKLKVRFADIGFNLQRGHKI